MANNSALNHSATIGDNSFSSCSSFLTVDMKKQLPPTAAPYAITLITVNAIMTPFIIYINLLVLWTICKNRRLRSASYNVLLAGLAFNDLFVGLVVQPIFLSYRVTTLLRSSLQCPMTFAYAGALMFFTSWSLNTLMIISLERYLSIHFPLSFNAVVTNKKVIVGTALLWVCVPISMLLVVLLGLDYSVRKVFVVLVFGSNVVVTVFATVKVQRAAHQQRRSIAAQQATVQGEEARKISECKRAFTTGIVVITTVGLYCPLIAVFIVVGIKGDQLTSEFKVISATAGATFVHMQSFINPLILSLRLSYIWEGVRKNLCCCK